MKSVALLVFGQFRTASTILQQNLQQIKKSNPNDSDIHYHIYILTDKDPKGNYSELTLSRVQNICKAEQVDIKLISYWEDLIQYHEKDKEIMDYFISIAKGKAGYGDKMWFTANMWYRRYVLWELFLSNSIQEYDLIFLFRPFDTKIINIKPIQNIEDNTIYFCMDTMIMGKKEILDKFFKSLTNLEIWIDFEWTDEFTKLFASFDSCLAYHKPTFCSEAQMFNYIYRAFPQWKNIRWDYNARSSPSHIDAIFNIQHVHGRETFRDV